MTRIVTVLVALALALVGAPVAAADEENQVSLVDIIASPSNNSTSIEQIIEQSIHSVGQFNAAHGLPPAKVVAIPEYTEISVPYRCGSIADSGDTFLFCPSDDTVYIGVGKARRLNYRYDLAIAISIAHENGHHQQYALQGDVFTALRQKAEDGADCMAGAWLAWSNQISLLNISFADLPGLAKYVNSIARQSADTDDVHGTLADRSIALAKGFYFGIQACNEYTPVVPVS